MTPGVEGEVDLEEDAVEEGEVVAAGVGEAALRLVHKTSDLRTVTSLHTELVRIFLGYYCAL